MGPYAVIEDQASRPKVIRILSQLNQWRHLNLM